MSRFSVYQVVAIFGGDVFNLDAHIHQLNISVRDIYHKELQLDRAELLFEFRHVIRQQAIAGNVMHAVRINIYDDLSLDLHYEGHSIYQGYAHRCVSPRAHLVYFSYPITAHSCSAREAVTQLSILEAEHAGAPVALRCNPRGEVCSGNGYPLFAIRDSVLYSSPLEQSVEGDLVLRAARDMGLSTPSAPILVKSLNMYDELFFVDCYGLTTISECEGVRYMSIVSSKIANLMAQLAER